MNKREDRFEHWIIIAILLLIWRDINPLFIGDFGYSVLLICAAMMIILEFIGLTRWVFTK